MARTTTPQAQKDNEHLLSNGRRANLRRRDGSVHTSGKRIDSDTFDERDRRMELVRKNWGSGPFPF